MHVFCAHMSVQRPTSWKGIILHMTERLGKTKSLFFIFVLSPMSHFWNKCIVMFYAFFQIIKYKWDVNWLSKHNKNIMQRGMFALNGSGSKGSLWRLVRGEVIVVCLLFQLFENRRMTPGCWPNRTFQSLLRRDEPLNSASQVLYTECCSNLDRSWPLQL